MTQQPVTETMTVASGQRVLSVDALRGLIMIFMALDHANMLLSTGSSGEFWGGPLPRFSSAGAFWARFVTHLCAPGFFFLMGVGMVYLWHSRREAEWSRSRILRLFTARGLLIVVIHFLLSLFFALPQIMAGRFGIVFNVLYILGFSMMAAAWFLDRSITLMLTAAGVSLVLPELILANGLEYGQSLHPLLHILTVPGPMGHSQVYYTFFSWFGLTLLGTAFGRWALQHRQQAFKTLPWISAAAMAAFMVLRLANGFGNIRPMEGSGWMSFLLLNKYPPSLTFIFFMMSVNLLLLYVIEKLPEHWLPPSNPLMVFGRSALFFYILHHFIYIAMMLAGLNGLTLVQMLPLWVVGVALCYPFCRWYASFKRRQKPTSRWRML